MLHSMLHAPQSLVYPFKIHAAKRMPLSVWAMSFTFCVWNGFLQASGCLFCIAAACSAAQQHTLFTLASSSKLWCAQGYALAYRMSASAPPGALAVAGMALQLVGLLGTIHADHTLVNLRKPGETGAWHSSEYP